MKKKLKRVGVWVLFLFGLVPFFLLSCGVSLLGKNLHRLGECLKERYFEWTGKLL